MKYLLFLFWVSISNKTIIPGNSPIGIVAPSPLSEFSTEWNKEIYSSCNTAFNAIYMSDREREAIYILNLARTYPKLFANTVVTQYPSFSGDDDLINDEYYFQSLLKKMLDMEPGPLLTADKKCFESAACHAKTSGKSGYTGHDRQSAACEKKTYYSAECCDYGNQSPIDIIMSLLIDKDVPSLGHRNALLGSYTRIGVSIQPHTTYRHNAVFDFYF